MAGEIHFFSAAYPLSSYYCPQQKCCYDGRGGKQSVSVSWSSVNCMYRKSDCLGRHWPGAFLSVHRSAPAHLLYRMHRMYRMCFLRVLSDCMYLVYLTPVPSQITVCTQVIRPFWLARWAGRRYCLDVDCGCRACHLLCSDHAPSTTCCDFPLWVLVVSFRLNHLPLSLCDFVELRLSPLFLPFSSFSSFPLFLFLPSSGSSRFSRFSFSSSFVLPFLLLVACCCCLHLLVAPHNPQRSPINTAA